MGCGTSKADAAVAAASVSHLKLDRHRTKHLWAELRVRLHIGRDLENSIARDDLFTLMDTKRTGMLTLDQVIKGCDEIIDLTELTDNLEPIVTRAFKAACGRERKRGKMVSVKKREESLSHLERSEFLAFLVYVRDYFELWAMFDEVDSSDDFGISLEEFKTAVPLIEVWRRNIKIKDPVATFALIDTNNDRVVSFIEFAEWAIVEQLDYDGDDDEVSAVAPPPSKVEPDYLAMITASAKKKDEQISKFTKLKARLPLSQTSVVETEERSKLFKKFDVVKNRRLTLPEVILGCRNVLRLNEFTPHSDAIATHAFRESRRGFVSLSSSSGTSKKTVGFLDFRLLLCYIYDYFELMYMFTLIDSSTPHGGNESVRRVVDVLSHPSMKRSMERSSTTNIAAPNSGDEEQGLKKEEDNIATTTVASLPPTNKNAAVDNDGDGVVGNPLDPSSMRGLSESAATTTASPLITAEGNTNPHATFINNNDAEINEGIEKGGHSSDRENSTSWSYNGNSTSGVTTTTTITADLVTTTPIIKSRSNLAVPVNNYGTDKVKGAAAAAEDEASTPLIDFTGGAGKSYQDDNASYHKVSVGTSSMTLSTNPTLFTDNRWISYQELSTAKDHLTVWLRRPVVLEEEIINMGGDIESAKTTEKGTKKKGEKTATLKPLSISEIFREADQNGDGRITFMEFVSWATRHKLDADGQLRYQAVGGKEYRAVGLSLKGHGGVQSMPGGSIRI